MTFDLSLKIEWVKSRLESFSYFYWNSFQQIATKVH